MYVRMEIVNNSLSCCLGEFMNLLHIVPVVCLLVCLLAFVSVCLFVAFVGYLFRVWESSGTSCNSCISLPAQPHISTLYKRRILMTVLILMTMAKTWQNHHDGSADGDIDK